MQTETNTWEHAYQQVESLWHIEPDPILVQYATLLSRNTIADEVDRAVQHIVQ